VNIHIILFTPEKAALKRDFIFAVERASNMGVFGVGDLGDSKAVSR
jgi:hypothetical protein